MASNTVKKTETKKDIKGSVKLSSKKETAEKVAKPKQTDYHIVQREDGQWHVKREVAGKALKIFKTQAEAIAFAKVTSKNQGNNIVIHKTNGKIRKQDYSKK